MKQHILKYVFYFILFACIFNVLLYLYFTRNDVEAAKINGTLEEKLGYYKSNKEKYKIIFAGDSRTYTNIHNPIIDSTFGCKSINLAMWANWFPTQYPFFQNILPVMPDSTVLIWSIGHQNFSHSTDFSALETTFPIGTRNIFKYLNWGFSLSDVTKNIKKYDLNSILFTKPDWMKYRIDGILQKEVLTIRHQKDSSGEKVKALAPLNFDAFNYVEEKLRKNRDVLSVSKVMSHDTITSAEVYWYQGNYRRVELDSLFFRNKQKQDKIKRSRQKNRGYKADERYWNNFVAIVELLKTYKNVKVIVNEFEEAPYVYEKGDKEGYEQLMKEVNAYLYKNGFTIIKADFSNFKNADYFDFNHMNNKGAVRYTYLLSNLLKPNIAF